MPGDPAGVDTHVSDVRLVVAHISESDSGGKGNLAIDSSQSFAGLRVDVPDNHVLQNLCLVSMKRVFGGRDSGAGRTWP